MVHGSAQEPAGGVPEGLLEAVAQSSVDALISKSTAGVILSWNPAAELLFGYRPGEAIGRHISLIIPFERLYEEDLIIAKLLSGERISRFETFRVHKDGHSIPVELTISPIRDASGRVIGASKVARDLTALREAQRREQALVEASEESAARFHAIFEQGASLMAILAIDGRVIEANRAACEDWGVERAQVIGHHFADGPWWEDSSELRDALIVACTSAATGDAHQAMRHARRPDGEARLLDVTICPIRDEHETIIQLVAVGVDVSERERSAAGLRAASAELIIQNRRKDEFIATLAHELRNPLAAVRTSVSILRSPRLGSETLESTRLILERQVTQMARLLDDLLDASRVTRGLLELHRDIVELHASIDDAMNVARPAFAAAGVALHTQVTPTPLLAHADATRVQQMVDNVLINAAKYTPRGGMALLTVDADGSDLVITVTDTGIGIDPLELDRVFDMFTTVRSEKVAWKNGLGVGLFIVKRLAELHGGTVVANSAGPDMGSTFVLRLPVLMSSTTSAPGPVSGDASEEVRLQSSSARRVLIVEDDADNSEALQMFLRAHGCQAAAARDGRSALAQAVEFKPAVVILDLGLPDMNGWDVCRQLKAMPGATPYVVALTGWGQAEARRQTREAGVDQHLVKPIDPSEILKILAARES